MYRIKNAAYVSVRISSRTSMRLTLRKNLYNLMSFYNQKTEFFPYNIKKNDNNIEYPIATTTTLLLSKSRKTIRTFLYNHMLYDKKIFAWMFKNMKFYHLPHPPQKREKSREHRPRKIWFFFGGLNLHTPPHHHKITV